VSTPRAETTQAKYSERSIFLPHGRIGRVTYGVRWTAVMFGFYLAGTLNAETLGSGFESLPRYLAYLLFAFMVMTSIKRLHDMGYSAWAVIFLGPVVPLLLLLPGDAGSNAFGNPPPKSPF